MKFSEIHKFTTWVRYSDLDMYSVVYHPNYLILLDSARNQSFKDFGYPVEEQFKDKVGFTIAGIKNIEFKRPLFMDEKIDIFTEVISFSKRSCEVKHWIQLNQPDGAGIIVFNAHYNLVFVTISEIEDFPLDAQNVKGLKSLEFTAKVRSRLNFEEK